MSENTKIEWAHHTFNPWEGCTKIGPGCDHCYAETRNKRFHGGNWGPGAPRRRTSEANWKLPLKWNREAAKTGVRFRVFCASLADVFDNEVDQLWREDLWTLIEATPNLDWLLLTKRIGNVPDMVPSYWMNGEWPSHAWLGATVVNQFEVDRDVHKLLCIGAEVRFISVEPMLGAIDLGEYLYRGDHELADIDPMAAALLNSMDDGRTWIRPRIDWVICGGESGTRARPMHPEWAKSLRDQCVEAGVKFHFKQWGEFSDQTDSDKSAINSQIITADGKTIGVGCKYGGMVDEDWREQGAAWMGMVGKKKAGRTLDGRTWDEFPGGAA
jgi:protein gp37